jgi:hypothetical protein
VRVCVEEKGIGRCPGATSVVGGGLDGCDGSVCVCVCVVSGYWLWT